MKKIILSLSMIAVVAVVVAGATGAFFSDTETSTGNTFTAGAIDLTVDSEQHYNGNVCAVDAGDVDNDQNFTEYVWLGSADYPVEGTACDGTWLPANLGAHKFFNFLDVKPGDEGENTISLHIDNNDAYACVDVNVYDNDDNTPTEPELADDPDQGPGLGELAENVNFFAWSDWGVVPGFQGNDATEGDNVWQIDEPALFSNIGPASDVLGGKTYTLADSYTGPLVGNTTSYIGLAWCAGAMTANAGVITCDGSGMNNETQTDSFKADIAFRVEQSRNNDEFQCDD